MKLNEFINKFASEHKIANIDDLEEGVVIAPLSEVLWLIRTVPVKNKKN